MESTRLSFVFGRQRILARDLTLFSGVNMQQLKHCMTLFCMFRVPWIHHVCSLTCLFRRSTTCIVILLRLSTMYLIPQQCAPCTTAFDLLRIQLKLYKFSPCELIPTRCNRFCAFVISTLNMFTWVGETCLWLSEIYPTNVHKQFLLCLLIPLHVSAYRCHLQGLQFPYL
jgi:hypothetical protein